MEELATLIYETDPYIYPFWFNNNLEEAKKVLVPRIKEPGFIYNYENCYIAYDIERKKIVGVICAINPTTDLNYDYNELESINDNYNFTINHYVKELIDEVVNKKYMYLVNVAVDVEYRNHKIGKRLLSYFIEKCMKQDMMK